MQKMSEKEAIAYIERHAFISDEAKDMAITAIKEIQQYRAIGTLEECREAVERMTPKTPDLWGDGYSNGRLVYDMWNCPSCGKSYEVDCEKHEYCPECGQSIDWEEWQE